MTAPFKRIIAVGIILIVITIGLSLFVVTGGCTKGYAPLDNARNGVINTVIDASGVNDRIDSALRAKGAEIAEEYNSPPAMVTKVIDDLDIKDWKAVTLPENSKQTGTYSFTYENTPIQLTTYEDPSVVTVVAYDQTVTMEVPESARSYVSLAEDLGVLSSSVL